MEMRGLRGGACGIPVAGLRTEAAGRGIAGAASRADAAAAAAGVAAGVAVDADGTA